MQLQPPSTYKMQRGAEKHEQQIRKYTHTRDGAFEKYFNLYFKDEELGLIGLIDYLESDGDELIPVEYKTGHPQDGSETDYHRAQLVAQALLVERHFHHFVRKVKIVYEQLEAPVLFEISGADKVSVLQMLETMRNIINQELLPEPTPHEAKCQDCEFWRVCLRI